MGGRGVIDNIPVTSLDQLEKEALWSCRMQRAASDAARPLWPKCDPSPGTTANVPLVLRSPVLQLGSASFANGTPSKSAPLRHAMSSRYARKREPARCGLHKAKDAGAMTGTTSLSSLTASPCRPMFSFFFSLFFFFSFSPSSVSPRFNSRTSDPSGAAAAWRWRIWVASQEAGHHPS